MMNSTIIVAVIAAVVTAAGWLTNYVLSTQSERSRHVRASRLAHVERQLEKLYGPLYFLVEEGEASFRDLLDNLKRSYVFPIPASRFEDDLKVWLFWVDHDLMPRNEKIESLLSSQAHLLIDGALPASYHQFIRHFSSWIVNHRRWKEEGVPYEWKSKTNWPNEFTDDIRSSFTKLKQEQAHLMGVVRVKTEST